MAGSAMAGSSCLGRRLGHQRARALATQASELDYADLLRARTLIKAGQSEDARAVLETLLASESVDDEGVPLAFYAAGRLLSMRDDQARVLDLVDRHIATHEWRSPLVATFVRGLAGATLEHATLPADRARAEADLAAADALVAEIDRAKRLQRELTSLHLGTDEAPGANPTWIPFDEATWLVSAAPSLAGLPPFLIAVRAAPVFELVGASASTASASTVRSTLKISTGTEGQALGEGFPGLRVSVVGGDRGVTLQHWTAGSVAFERLPAGRYTVWATKAAWVPVWYGSKRPGDSIGATSIVIAEGQAITGMSLKMGKGAAITGTITDLNGQPLPGFQASVRQSRMNFQTGVRTFVPVSSPELGMADNRGVYRIYGLAPGTYLVMAEDIDGPASFRLPSAAEWQWADSPAGGATPGPAAPDPSRPRAYAPVYHPGTSVQASATLVTVSAGEERSGIDIRIEPMAVSSIDVSVQLAEGAAMRDVLLAGIRTADESSEQMFGRRPDDTGRVTVPNMMPGAYTIVARPLPGATAHFWALADLVLTGADASVTLTLQPGLQVGGRVAFAATTAQPPADLKRVRVSLVPASPGAFAAVFAPSATADANGVFSFSNALPGKYRLTALIAGAGTNDAWSLASAMVRDRDALDVPIEIKPGEPVDAVITFTDRKTSLSGSLVDASGRPAPDYFVIAFPVDPAYWATGSRRIAAARPGVDGRYHLDLPPGSYLVGAVTDVEPFQWFDPAFLTDLKRQALPVTLTAGNATTQNLRLGGR